MAQWKQTLEPYIKVTERVKTVAQNPTAGESLIIGVALISDAGPSVPTLISSQSEFLSTYASQDMSQEYVESLNGLYTGADSSTAARMWQNAYRLAGSNTMLVMRANKGSGINFVQPAQKGDSSDYILREGELLKKVPKFEMYWFPGAASGHDQSNSLALNIRDVGIVGNWVDQTSGEALYDYQVKNIYELAVKMCDTSLFFSPDIEYYEAKTVSGVYSRTKLDPENNEGDQDKVNVVVFKEVYLGAEFLDKSNSKLPDGYSKGFLEFGDEQAATTIDLNAKAYSGFTPCNWYAMNTFNSATTLRARIRRFNHDAVVSKSITDTSSLTKNSSSPYTVLTSVLDIYTKKGTEEPSASILKHDFYEIAIWDPSVNGETSFFNVGSMLGLGDMEVSEINGLISMIQLQLPDDLHDLGLNYYGYGTDDKKWELKAVGTTDIPSSATWVPNVSSLPSAASKQIGDEVVVGNQSNKVNLWSEPVSSSSIPATAIWVATADQLPDPATLAENDTRAVGEEKKWSAISPIPSPLPAGTKWVKDEATRQALDKSGIAIGEYYAVGVAKKWELVAGADPADYPSAPVVADIDALNAVDTTSLPVDTTFYIVGGTSVYKLVTGTLSALYKMVKNDTGLVYTVLAKPKGDIYEVVENGDVQIFADVTIDPTKTKVISISDSDLKRALDTLAADEVYTTEGLCDLGNTELSFQNYMANMAVNDNYFYPISTVNSTNYMTIGNSATKITADSSKLYMSAPWDIDTGTMGWKFYACPGVLYWENVARNRRLNREFASTFGQVNGIVAYQRPTMEANKKTRQLLLSKRVNTVLWNVNTQAWNMNDCYTKQNEDNILGEDGNSRLNIRISKAMPTLLRQFIGKKIGEKLCADVVAVIEYFFKSTIMPMEYSVDAYQVYCDYDEILARQNKIKVIVNVRYSRSLKFIEVYNNAYDVGMDITGKE